MTIKVKHKKIDRPSVTFPWIGVSEGGRVVLFVSETKGLCLVNNDGPGVERGEFWDGFDVEKFRPFDGTVELSN